MTRVEGPRDFPLRGPVLGGSRLQKNVMRQLRSLSPLRNTAATARAVLRLRIPNRKPQHHDRADDHEKADGAGILDTKEQPEAKQKKNDP